MKKRITLLPVLSVCLLLLTGVNAIIAGILFVMDPSGAKMGMSAAYLAHSPFNTFLVPGLVLLVVNGLMNIIAAIACIMRYKHFPVLIILQGLLLSGWILIQVILVRDFNALHGTMLSIGAALVILGCLLKKQFPV